MRRILTSQSFRNNLSRYSGVAVDTWSLGVLLFLMLTGKYPFQPCPTRENMFKKICAGDFDVPGHVSQGARQVLSGLLQADPDKRMKLSSVRPREVSLRAAVAEPMLPVLRNSALGSSVRMGAGGGWRRGRG